MSGIEMFSRLERSPRSSIYHLRQASALKQSVIEDLLPVSHVVLSESLPEFNDPAVHNKDSGLREYTSAWALFLGVLNFARGATVKKVTRFANGQWKHNIDKRLHGNTLDNLWALGPFQSLGKASLSLSDPNRA